MDDTRQQLADQNSENGTVARISVEPGVAASGEKSVWLKVDSFETLLRHEPEIVAHIARVRNGGNLFMAHPFRLLAQIGVQLSEETKTEILAREPHLAALSDVPYDAILTSEERMSVRYHVRGLFARRSA